MLAQAKAEDTSTSSTSNSNSLGLSSNELTAHIIAVEGENVEQVVVEVEEELLISGRNLAAVDPILVDISHEEAFANPKVP